MTSPINSEKTPMGCATSYSELLSNPYKFSIPPDQIHIAVADYLFNKNSMDLQEAVAHLVLRYIEQFPNVIQRIEKSLGESQQPSTRKIVDWTNSTPLTLEDLYFTLNCVKHELFADSLSKDDLNETVQQLKDLIEVKKELKEEDNKKRAHLVAKKVSEYIIEERLFAPEEEERIRQLSRDDLTVEQFEFLKKLINSTEDIIVDEDRLDEVVVHDKLSMKKCVELHIESMKEKANRL